MKRREFLQLSATAAGATIAIYLPAGWTPAKAAAQWKVGFSQPVFLENHHTFFPTPDMRLI